VTTMEDKNGPSEMCSFCNIQPVQVTEQMSDVIVLLRVTGKVRHCIKNRLEPVQQVAKNTKQGRAAIVSCVSISDITNDSSTGWLTDLQMLQSCLRAEKQLDKVLET